MHYKVTAQYAGARELPGGDQFRHLDAAKAFIVNKLKENAALKIKVIYRLYEWDELLEEFDPAKIDLSALEEDSEGEGSQGQGKGASFRPSPLNTSPRPAGMPHSSFKDDDKKGDK
jgi:hypothetical protein